MGRHPARGGAAVEFALVLPLFMALVMGALDYGWFFYSSQVVTNASREAARSGTLVDPNGGGAQGTASTNAKTTGQAYMNSSGIGCPGGGNGCITVKFCPSPAPPITVVDCGTLPGNAVDVDITYDFKSLTGFMNVILPAKVHGHSIMRW